ncbi:MAG: fibronectin type III domain-containing protein [Nitrospiraceae bacterium]
MHQQSTNRPSTTPTRAYAAAVGIAFIMALGSTMYLQPHAAHAESATTEHAAQGEQSVKPHSLIHKGASTAQPQPSIAQSSAPRTANKSRSASGSQPTVARKPSDAAPRNSSAIAQRPSAVEYPESSRETASASTTAAGLLGNTASTASPQTATTAPFQASRGVSPLGAQAAAINPMVQPTASAPVATPQPAATLTRESAATPVQQTTKSAARVPSLAAAVSSPTSGAQLSVSPAALTFNVVTGATATAAQSIAVANTSNGTLTWAASNNQPWLQHSFTTSSISVSANPTGLKAGTYTGTVTLWPSSWDVNPIVVPVSLVVTDPAPTKPSLSATPAELTFTLEPGKAAAAPQTVAVSSSNGTAVKWAASNNQPWLQHSFTTNSVSVSASAVGLAEGTYNGTVTLWSDEAANAPKTIPVAMIVKSAAQAKISLAPTTLAFSATAGGSNPAAQTIAVSNVGTGTLSWTVSDNVAWLTTTQTGSTISAAANVAGMAAGTYTAAITVAASGATNTPQTVPVTFTVAAAPKVPTLSATPTGLAFTLEAGKAAVAPQTVAISTVGSTSIQWAASNNQPWLSHSFTTNSVSVSASAVGMSAGTYTGNITLWSDQATNAPYTIPVTMTVTAPAAQPKISFSPASLSFSGTAGGSNPTTQTIAVTNSGTGSLTWTVSDNAGWLTTTQTGSNISATVNLSGLAAGTYSSVVTIAATGATNTPQTLPVTLTVAEAVTQPTLAASPASVSFTLESGTSSNAAQTVTVSNAGSGTMTWAASSNQSWMTHSFTGTSVSVFANATGLAAGTYTGAVMLWSNEATNSPKTIPVTLTVTASVKPVIGLSPSSLSFNATSSGSNPGNQSIAISNSGAGTLTWSATDNASWLTVSQSGNTVVASVDKTGLTAGTYNALITVSASGAINTPQTIPVSLTLTQVTQSVSLSWNSNSESDLAGYKIYRATKSGGYGAPIATVQGRGTTYTVPGLTAGATYYFVITAYDNQGNESGWSNEVSKSIY